jgi:type IV pilus assembly protein PilY1
MKPTLFNSAVCHTVLASVLFTSVFPAWATTPLADKPPLSGVDVPGNLALTISVEFPTAISVAHPFPTDSASGRLYSSSKEYIGYFDPGKCYSYNSGATTPHFQPETLTSDRKCSGFWSGNFLNWATMQTIDPFRSTLTGGYRLIDTPTMTILEKANASNQGSDSNFPNSSILSNQTEVAGATPFQQNFNFRTSVRTRGTAMRFIRSNQGSFSGNAATPFTTAVATNNGVEYEVQVRVRVCDASKGIEFLEKNCVPYPNGGYKPEGLMQQYSNRIRYSVFGYLNDSNINRDGAVLRAKQKYIGPIEPVPGGVPKANPLLEWDPVTGVMPENPNLDEANDSTALYGVPIVNSGVLNYVNEFGTVVKGPYKTYDPVGELYYAAHRYFRNVGNVPSWTDMGSASTATKRTWLDGFPAIQSWDDPILYACQRNFILGVGDVNSHADRNLPGASGGTEPTQPAAVSADLLAANNNTGLDINSTDWTNKIGALMGIGAIGNTQDYGGCCSNNGALMAGLAFQANVMDIRDEKKDPKMIGKQTIQTYWLDVLEYSTYKKNNQFYLATKYGGFDAKGYNPASLAAITTEISKGLWNTTPDTVPNGDPRPDGYYTADKAEDMRAGLVKIFKGISDNLEKYTTAFTGALPQVSTSGEGIYSSKYDASNWTGEVSASKVAFDASTGLSTTESAWKFSSTLGSLVAGTGWDTTRVIVTYRPDLAAKKGVPFRWPELSATQQAALDTSYVASDDSKAFLNFLRGDRQNEGKGYRVRAGLVGDIVNSKSRVAGKPVAPLSDAVNAGYSSYKTSQINRPRMVVVGTNQGVLHVIDGSLTGASAGREIMGYVPSSLFRGPSNTPSTNGLAALGKPDFDHYNFVDATPMIADVDFNKVKGFSGSPDWRTIAVGGLGKGGRMLYALDLTTAPSVTDETEAAKRVLWEFTDPDLGFQYAEPTVVKTAQHGWVVMVGSGYNNADGQGYLFIINPRTGDLIQKISTGVGTSSSQAGLAAINSFVQDVTDGTADTVYAGDLQGNLWRWDLTAPTGPYPAPLLMAQLTDGTVANLPLPVTARPLVVIQPGTKRRWVTVGTGRLLDGSDLSSSQSQRFYAIMDGFNAKFNSLTDLPPALGGFPFTNADMRQLTDISKKITLNLNNEIGWYLELGNGWRVLNDSTAFFGTVAFPAMVPTSSDPCKPLGSSRVYAIDLGDGQTSLDQGKIYDESLEGGVVTDTTFYSVAGKLFLFGGTQGQTTDGMQKPIKLKEFKKDTATRLNWRELPLSN